MITPASGSLDSGRAPSSKYVQPHGLEGSPKQRGWCVSLPYLRFGVIASLPRGNSMPARAARLPLHSRQPACAQVLLKVCWLRCRRRDRPGGCLPSPKPRRWRPARSIVRRVTSSRLRQGTATYVRGQRLTGPSSRYGDGGGGRSRSHDRHRPATMVEDREADRGLLTLAGRRALEHRRRATPAGEHRHHPIIERRAGILLANCAGDRAGAMARG